MPLFHKNLLPGLLLVLAFSACQSSSSDKTPTDTLGKTTIDSIAPALPLDSVLIPGESLGNIKIGTDAEGIYQSMGRPDSSDAAMQKAVATWYKGHDPKSYTTSIYTVRDTGNNPPARVKQIRSTDPSYRTAENIGVSSTLKEIRKFYVVNQLDGYPADHNTTLYDDSSGIAFEIDASGRCVAILLHPRGEEIKATNLPLR